MTNDNGEDGGIAAGALQSDGPLRGIVFTGLIERENPEIRQTLAFTTDDAEVTAVIGLGDVRASSTLVVTWYRTAGFDEREVLFAHEIDVGTGGLVFAQAVAPSGLAPGIYVTEATLDGHVVHTPWIVQDATGSTTGTNAQGVSEDEIWEVPSKGDSWWDEFGGDPPPPQDASDDVCTITSINGSTVPMRDVKAHAFWLGPCTGLSMTATVSGPSTTIASTSDSPLSFLYGQTDVCDLSGGSDLPGTVVHFELTGRASASEDYTLPDHGEVLTAGLEGLPEAGSRVEPGDQIKLHAIALLFPPALGVQTLYVDDGSNLLESVGNLSGSDVPVACDPRRLAAELFTEYEVPAGASPLLELCATGVGFDGTESKSCIQYAVAGRFLGLTGTELRFIETTRVDESGGFQKITERQESVFSLAGVDESRLQGEARITYSRVIEVFRSFVDECQTTIDTYGPVEWDAALEGTYSVQSDGNTAVNFTATPFSSPDYTYSSTTSGCPEFDRSSTETGVSWGGGGWNLVNGRYDLREDYELQTNVSGEDYYEVHLRATDAP